MTRGASKLTEFTRRRGRKGWMEREKERERE